MVHVNVDQVGRELSVKQPAQWESMDRAAFKSVSVSITRRAAWLLEPAAVVRDTTANPVNTVAQQGFLAWPVLRPVTAEWGRRVTTGQDSVYVHQDIMGCCAKDAVKLALTEQDVQSHVTAQVMLHVTH